MKESLRAIHKKIDRTPPLVINRYQFFNSKIPPSASLAASWSRLAKEHGMTLEKAMLSLCFKDDIQDSVRASIWKSYLESLVKKEVEQKVDVVEEKRMSGPLILPPRALDAIRHLPREVRSKLPAVILPEKRVDPALEVSAGEDEKEVP